MLKQLKNNEEGVVFVTILMIIIVMMVLTISIIGMNVSQVMLTEGEVKRIQAEILAMGALTLTFANQLSESPSNSIYQSVTLGDTTFDIWANIDESGTGIYDTDQLNITVTYD